jgi:ribosomal protein S21
MSTLPNRAKSVPHGHVAGDAILAVEVKHHDADVACACSIRKQASQSGIIRALCRRCYDEKPSTYRRRQKCEGMKHTRKRDMAFAQHIRNVYDRSLVI